MRRVVKRGQQKKSSARKGNPADDSLLGQRSRTGKVRGVTPLQGMGEEKRGEVIWLDASVVGIGNRRDSGYDRKKLTDERLAERLAGREGRALGQSRLFRREQQLCSRRQQRPEHCRLGQDPALSRKRRLFRFPYQSFHGAPSCRRTLYHTAAPFCKQFFVHSKKFHSKD